MTIGSGYGMFRVGPNLIFLPVIHPCLTCLTQFVSFDDPSLTISPLHCWLPLAGHTSPCLGKLPWGPGVRPRLDHPALGPHAQGPRVSTLQLDPQKQPTHPSCYGAGGSH